MTDHQNHDHYALFGDLPSVVRVQPGEGVVPGLYDVQFADGTWRNDLTTGQVRYLTDVRDQ